MGQTPDSPSFSRGAESDEHLLIVLVGLSPAVLTETVYALCCADEPDIPDRVLAITTQNGKQRLEEALFRCGGWDSLIKSVSARIDRPLGGALRFGLADDCIRVLPSTDRTRNLDDIRCAADHFAVGDYLMETLRGLCEDHSLRITASIAGGRKTMGAMLLSVMGLLGRFHDRVVHVLVNEPWERFPDFLYPGCPGDFIDTVSDSRLDSNQARLTLADVPFVPLRSLFRQEIGKASGSYRRLVKQLRLRAAEVDTPMELRLDLESGTVSVNERQVALSKMEFAFYAALANRAASGEDPVSQFIDLEPEVIAIAKRHHNSDTFDHWSHAVLEAKMSPKEDYRRYASSIRSKLVEAGFSQLHVERLVPHKGRMSIDVPPDCIELVF